MESEPSSSLSDLGELDTPESLNRAYLYSDSALSDDADISHLFPMAVPVTPSPVSRRRRRRSRMAGNLAVVPLTSAESGPVPSDPERKRPVDPVVTPSTRQRQKRRRLQTAGSSPGSGGESSSLASDASASAPAPGSSRRSPPWCPWLESPLPSAASSSASSVSSACSRAPSPLVNGETSGSRDLGGTAAPGPAADHRASGTRRARRPKRTQTASSRTRALRGSGGAHRRSAAASRAEGEGVSFVAQMHGTPAHAPLYQIEDEVVIIDDDDDDDEDDGVVVETVVRSIQMEEDEAFARSLQEQFDREEQLQQEWRSPQAQAPPHDQSFEPFFGLRWLTPRATPMDSSSFLSQFPQLERILGGPFTGRGRNSAIGRAWGSRQRRANQMLHNILDDSQGNNYEALLALEEGQGVVVKKTMSKRQIDQLPTRAFDLAHSTGQTQCQICLSDYTHGERLRVLPCLHDYHAKCVDSWLKENATCPICRADAEEGGAL